MTEPGPDRITHECHTFVQYLVATRPTEYVLRKYQAAHEQGCVETTGASSIDELLLRIARVRPVLTAAADAHARCFRPASALRRKLVLLAAILESTAPGYHAFESPPPASFVIVLARVAGRCAVFAGLLVSGMLTIGPVHLGLRLIGRAREPHKTTVLAR